MSTAAARRFLVAAVAATLIAGLWSATHPERGLDIVCPVLPNRVVPVFVGLARDCPLHPLDRVERIDRTAEAPAGHVRVRVRRGSASLDVDVPSRQPDRDAAALRVGSAGLLVTFFLTAILFGVARSKAPGGSPLAAFHVGIGIVLITVADPSAAAGLSVPYMMGSALIPAALAHLGLTLRDSAAPSRVAVTLPYAVSAVLCVLALGAALRFPVVWSLIERLLFSASLIAGVLVAVAAAVAVREAPTELEKRRQRVFLVSLLLAIGLPAIMAFAPGGSDPVTLVLFAAAAAPLPLAYATARYDFFEADLKARRSAAHVVYLALATAALFAVIEGVGFVAGRPAPGGDRVVRLAIVLAAVASFDAFLTLLRGMTRRWIAPTLQRWERAAAETGTRLADIRDPELGAQWVAEGVMKGLDAEGAAVFIVEDEQLRLGGAVGEAAPVHAELARFALALAPETPARLEEVAHGTGARALRLAGVQAVCAIRHGTTELGVILVGGAKRLHCYTDLHMAFLASLATQAASCMRNAQLSERLLVAERYAGYGRLRAELAHEVGKPLGSAQVMAQRLAERLPRPARDDAAALLALVKEARGVLAEIEQQRTTSDAVSPGVGASVAEAAERAVRIIEGSVGLHRVSVRIPEGLAWVQCPSTSLVRVLSNLLDNAVRATAPEEVVELAAEAQGAGVAIEVSDRGCGMPEEDLRRAFLPFFSTREDGAGRGLGLSITREIVSGNDGMIDLASDEGVGTRVRVWFPTVPERQKSAAGARGSGGIG